MFIPRVGRALTTYYPVQVQRAYVLLLLNCRLTVGRALPCRYNVPGVMNGDDLVDPLTLYPITCVPRVFAVFKNMKSEHDVKGIIEVRGGV